MKKLFPFVLAAAIIGPLVVFRLMSPPETIGKACTKEVGTISGDLVVDMRGKTVQYEGSTETYTLDHVGSC